MAKGWGESRWLNGKSFPERVHMSKRKAIAARAPETGETIARSFDSGKELMGGMSATMLVTC